MGASQSSDTPKVIPTNSSNNNSNAGDVVVIPVDGSRQAETALLWYMKHVHKPNNVVRVVHCQEYPIAQANASIGEQMERIKKNGRGLVNRYEKKLEEYQLQGSVSFESGGSPGEVICRAASEMDASMIIMGTRGLGLIRRTILGSVSDYVIQHTKIPVTVIPAEISNKWF